MIQKITIQNFKSVVDLELELGQLNIFIGENGGGKTNILEAVAFGSAGFLGAQILESTANIKGVRFTESELMASKFKKERKAITILFKDNAFGEDVLVSNLNAITST